MWWYILFIIVTLIYISQLDVNKKRHLTNSYPYAHFSQITNINYMLYPGLLFTRPTYITLNSGDALYIPRKWWHWIRTEPGTHAINFIFNAKTSIESKPLVIDRLISTSDIRAIQEVIDKRVADRNYDNWNNASYSTLNYFITLNGYNIFKKNMNIKDKIKDISALSDIKDKYAQAGSEFDYNFWLSLSEKGGFVYHDTGLHFDSLDSILYVINGTKIITLYPPEDSYLLAPLDITPNYALQTPIFMYYNAYSKGNIVGGKPSGHLLYKTLESCSSLTRILSAVQKLYDLKKDKEIIWGFKKSGDVYRWEFYYYHFSPYNAAIIEKHDFSKRHLGPAISSYALDVLNKENTIIHSIDIENTEAIYNDEIHTYDVSGSRTLPFYGKGFDIKNEYKKQVGIFVYDSAAEVKKKYIQYLKELRLPHSLSVLNILLKYPCEYMCIWNKNGDLFVQWIAIRIESFISFLEEFKYKEDLVAYIKMHIEDYTNLSHEITIVYDPVTLIAKRSGFYGCI
jgi:hypothetical protein